MPDLRTRSTPRSLVAVALVVAALLSFASAVAWAEWDEVEAALGGTAASTFADAERRPRVARPPGGADQDDPAGVADPATSPAVEPAEAGDAVEPADADVPVEPTAPAVAGTVEPHDRAAARAVRDPSELIRRRATRALEQWLAQHPDLQSVAVAVVAGGPGGTRWSGAAAGEPAHLLDHTAPYSIMSVTKTFTEALVLRQAAAGAIDLDAPMPAIPGVAPLPEGITITPRMLLQHSSGLVNYMNADGYDPAAPMTPAHAVSLSLGTALLAEPGTRAHYSNSNFHWLGLLLEHVTGRPFAELVADLAGEYGLTSAAVDPAARPGWVGFASGGMRATLADVASWGAHLFTPGDVLSPDDLTAYRSVGALGVGLGIWPICPCTTAPDGAVEYTAIGQIVADGGLLHFPDDDIVVAVRLSNVPGDVGTITASVAGAMRAAFADDGPVRVQ